jgi:putative transposase
MARPLRIEFPSAVYHVTSRGNGRAAIYLDDGDREAFLKVLGEVCRRMRWLCYSYCLMTNHYHLVIETLDNTLSKGMRQLNGVYTQCFNRHHGRVGHVFQGRYKAILVDREPYLLELVRYVVLNPIRANMVTSPEQWRWSSYHATAGQAHTPDWLATEWVLRQFGTRRTHAHARFAQFVRDGQTQPSIWDGLRNQIYLGDEQFVARMQSQINDEKPLDEIPRVQRRMCRLSLEDFARQHGNQRSAMAAAYLSGAHTMKAIASYFGVHYSTVSRAVSGAERRRGK